MYILGGVFSQKEGFTSLNDLWGAFAFHAITTGLGVGLIGKTIGARQPAPEASGS